MSLEIGEPVCVLSRSTGKWLRDGVIVEVLEEPATVDGQAMPAGAIKVLYANNESAKWVPPEAFGEELAAADFLPGDKVSVFVRSMGLWVSDGLVEKVLMEAAEVDGQNMPSGAIMVTYQSGESGKWIPPQQFGVEVKAQRTLPEDLATRVYTAPGVDAPKTMEATSSLPTVSDEDALVVSQVDGAAKVAGGRYAKVGTHNEKPKYKNSNGSIIFFDDWWKLNLKDDVKQWCYEVRGATNETAPPMGVWHCTRFFRNGSHPPLTISGATETDKIVVSGATGKSAVVNGPYTEAGVCNEMPKYKNSKGAIMFYDSYWKINVTDDTWTWHYSVKEATGPTPPSGNWAPQRTVGAETPAIVKVNL